ncbi:hypothetical protein LTR94_027077, partial [Friedmanniomyces endolithicus]
MRFQSDFADRAQEIIFESRSVERADVIETVRAPAGWGDCQIEAWLDWGDAQPTNTRQYGDWLYGAVDQWAQALAQRGLEKGVFKTRKDAQSFADELIATVQLGLATPAAPSQSLGIADLADPSAERRLEEHAAEAASQRLANRSAEALAQALCGVADAVDRCDGSIADCADPARNPALGRAAAVARSHGAADLDIFLAIDGTRPNLRLEPLQDRAHWIAFGRRDQMAAGAPQAMTAAKAALDAHTLVAFDRRDAELACEAAQPRAVINLDAVVQLRDPVSALGDLAGIWTTALAIQDATSITLGLEGFTLATASAGPDRTHLAQIYAGVVWTKTVEALCELRKLAKASGSTADAVFLEADEARLHHL